MNYSFCVLKNSINICKEEKDTQCFTPSKRKWIQMDSDFQKY